MIQTFVHEAVLQLDDGADYRAPGAAITEAVCGSHSHEGPCPLAPHHTSAFVTDTATGALNVRTVFAVQSEMEGHVRELIIEGLTGSHPWSVLTHGASELAGGESDLGRRLVTSLPTNG